MTFRGLPKAFVFQFTPLREGRRPLSVAGDDATLISIHAPARGATREYYGFEKEQEISIHAPARGATPGSISLIGDGGFQFTPLREGRPTFFAKLRLYYLFQFTPLREGRRRSTSFLVSPKDISIHAPARGATQYSFAGLKDVYEFQFTPLREGRRGL